MQSETSQLHKTNSALFHLYEISKAIKLIEAESRMWLPGVDGTIGSGSIGIEFQPWSYKSSKNLLHNKQYTYS